MGNYFFVFFNYLNGQGNNYNFMHKTLFIFGLV